MRRKSSTKPADEPREKMPRKRRHTRTFYETANYLDTLRVSAEEMALCADVLALWTRYMLAANPSAAGAIYRALGDAWEANRAEKDHDERERIAVNFHAAFLNRLREKRGEQPRCSPTKSEREQSADLEKLMASTLDQMRARVTHAAVVAGEGGRPSTGIKMETDRTDPAPGDAPAPVVYMAAYLDSHPRPVRNLLFAEKQD